jgi:uncharacterized protein (TIGR02246 family)
MILSNVRRRSRLKKSCPLSPESGITEVYCGTNIRMNMREFAMRKNVLVIALLMALVAPAAAQKAQIEAVNAKWMELFNKGDFEGIAQLYTADAIAFPPGSAMVRGKAAIGAMWKGMAEQAGNPKVTTLEVKRLGPAAAREIGTFSLTTKGPSPKEISGKYLVVWERVRGQWKLAADIWNDGK